MRPVDSGEPLWFQTHRGQPMCLRRALGADIPGLTELLRSLSARTLRFRYLVGRSMNPLLVAAEVTRILRGTGPQHIALLVTSGAGADQVVVGMAEVVFQTGEPTVGEFSILVRDDMQRMGIGTALMREAVALCQARGAQRLHADTLPENEAFRRLLRRLDLPYTTRTASGVMEVAIDLTGRVELPREPVCAHVS